MWLQGKNQGTQFREKRWGEKCVSEGDGGPGVGGLEPLFQAAVKRV